MIEQRLLSSSVSVRVLSNIDNVGQFTRQNTNFGHILDKHFKQLSKRLNIIMLIRGERQCQFFRAKKGSMSESHLKKVGQSALTLISSECLSLPYPTTPTPIHVSISFFFNSVTFKGFYIFKKA